MGCGAQAGGYNEIIYVETAPSFSIGSQGTFTYGRNQHERSQQGAGTCNRFGEAGQ